LIGGVYGVGGGAIMSPFLVSIFNLPVRAIAGASLLSTLITSLGGAAAFGWLSLALDSPRGAPDWGLGLLLGAGGFCGMYLGARCQKFIPGRLIKSSLAAVVIFTGMLYLYKCFI
ncbi:MAG: sulfite exporter TauE/SafE family protein, partial [Desulfovibrio sp.]|nr:sulfite exporter TauE/SafE family protein [Desulfovibrio sp.]